MNENTINADVTMGDATDAILAGRYRVVRQIGQPLRRWGKRNET